MQIYPTKSQFADFLKTYAETLQLPISLNTELLTTEWDQDKQRWNVRVRLNGDSSLECEWPRLRYALLG
jgi:cation diffusion facilitator CzcD-associated flavoprotein CzcO